jgi:hypothetical protein
MFAAIGITSVLGTGTTAADTVNFSDDFSPPSPLWSNVSGAWAASGGDYFATVPNNSPEAWTLLPFVLTNVNDQVTVTVNNLGDGGIVLEAPAGTNYALFVTGGEGYGQGNRSDGAGNSAYWATAAQPGATLNEATGVFTPGDPYTITVTDIAGTLSAYNDVDGSFDSHSVLLTSFTDPTLTSVRVGLYDDQPNTTTGFGFGPAQSFSNLSVTGIQAGTSVPEPETWRLMLTGIFALIAYRLKRAFSDRLRLASGPKPSAATCI